MNDHGHDIPMPRGYYNATHYPVIAAPTGAGFCYYSLTKMNMYSNQQAYR